MRLLTVIIILPSFAGGGAERVALSLLDNIDRKKFKPILIVLNKMGPLRANIPKENIINLNIVHLRFAIFKLISAHLIILILLNNSWALKYVSDM